MKRKNGNSTCNNGLLNHDDNTILREDTRRSSKAKVTGGRVGQKENRKSTRNSQHRSTSNTGSSKTRSTSPRVRWSFESSIVNQANDVGDHWFFAQREVTGEQRLWWSVLLQAIYEYLKPEGDESIKVWIMSRSEEVGSYLFICASLNIQANNLRKKVFSAGNVSFTRGMSKTWGKYDKLKGGRGNLD